MISDFAILGGGVIGLTLARQLMKEGHSVTVIERNVQLANEASQAGGGIISPLHPWRYSEPMLALAQWSHDVYPKLAEELSFATGIYVPIINTGMLVPNTEEASQALACNFLKAQRLSADQVFNIEPGLSSPCESVWVPEVNNIRNPALCRALIADTSANPLFSSVLNTQLKSVNAGEMGVQIKLQSGETLHAAKFVVAAGAWSSDIIKEFMPNQAIEMPPIYPVKGQMIALQTKVGTVRTVVLKDHHYIIPRHDGVVVLGSTVEYKDFDRTITHEAFAQLMTFGEELFPALKKCKVLSQWSGFRPGSDRDAPIISSLNEQNNLYISSGHFRNGLLSAPASAQLMTDLLLERDSSFDKTAYSL